MAEQFFILDVNWYYFKIFFSRNNVSFYYIYRTPTYEVVAIDARYVYRTVLTDTADSQDFCDSYKHLSTDVPSIDTAIALSNVSGTGYDGSSGTGVTPGSPISVHNATLISGSDGTNAQVIRTDSTGAIVFSGSLNSAINIQDSNGNPISSTDGLLNVLVGSPLKIQDSSGNSIDSTSGNLNIGITGSNIVKIQDSSGNNLASTGNALDVNLKSQIGSISTTLDSALNSPVFVELTDGMNAFGTTGNPLFSNIRDSSGNSLTSTASALDVNLKSQTSVLKVSSTTANNALANPIFVELSDGTNSFGTEAHPVFSNIQDSSGNSLTSTSNKLDVGITGANIVKIQDSSGSAITLSGGNLKTSLFDSSGNAAVVSNGSLQAATPAIALAGGSDGTNVHVLKTDTSGDLLVSLTGTNTINIKDSAGNSLTSTASALDVNLKSQTNAIKVSATTGNNTLANPLFVELSDGTNPFGTSGNPVFTKIQDTAGNSLTSTSNKLDVGITGANVVKIQDSSGSSITLAGGNLKTSLFDVSGNAAIVSDNTNLVISNAVVLVGGTDGTKGHIIKTDSSGNQLVSLTGISSVRIQDSSGNSLMSTSNKLDVGITGANTVKIQDSSGNTISSTSSALDINLKTSSINLPVSIAAQTLSAVSVSATNAANTVSNPIFVELSTGSLAFGTNAHPIIIEALDSQGNTIAPQAGTAVAGTQGGILVAGTDGTNARILATDTSGRQKISLFDGSGNSISSTSGSLNVGLTGANVVKLDDGSGNAITSTSSALDVNLKSQTNAVKVSSTTANNALNNPLFVQLSDGTNAITSMNGNVLVSQGSGPTMLSSEAAWQFAATTTSATTADQVILSYTVPAGKTFYLIFFEIAKATINNINGDPCKFFANGVEFARASLPGGTNNTIVWNSSFTAGYPIATAGQIVKLTVTPSGTTATTWQGRLIGMVK